MHGIIKLKIGSYSPQGRPTNWSQEKIGFICLKSEQYRGEYLHFVMINTNLVNIIWLQDFKFQVNKFYCWYRYLENIKFHPGLNDNIMEVLRNRLDSMEEVDREVCITFDEMEITSGYSYSPQLKRIFHVLGGKKKVQVAQVIKIIIKYNNFEFGNWFWWNWS